MKSKEEIEQLANDYLVKNFTVKNHQTDLCKKSLIYGYTQCQEDNEVEMDRLKKIMIESSNQAMTWEEKYWQLKNSLNKQD